MPTIQKRQNSQTLTDMHRVTNKNVHISNGFIM